MRAGRGLGRNPGCGFSKDIRASVWWLRSRVTQGLNSLREEDGASATGRALSRTVPGLGVGHSPHPGPRRTGNDLEGRGAG